MLTSLSRLLGLALSASAILPPATAEHRGLNRRQNALNANSVSTADFKSRFEQSGIVPDVIATLDPAVSFYAAYKAEGDQDALLVPGSTLTVSEASLPFEFSVENLNNVANITANTRYLVYLLDADAPDRNDPSARNLRHYLAGNYTVTSTTSSVLPSAQRLVLSSTNANPFTPFQRPAPAANTGVHRFVYALYTQPIRFNAVNFDAVGMARETSNWNLTEWRTQLGLGPAIGATFFSIDTEANDGEGTSGQVDSQANGESDDESDGSSNFPSYILMLSGAFLALV